MTVLIFYLLTIVQQFDAKIHPKRKKCVVSVARYLLPLRSVAMCIISEFGRLIILYEEDAPPEYTTKRVMQP